MTLDELEQAAKISEDYKNMKKLLTYMEKENDKTTKLFIGYSSSATGHYPINHPYGGDKTDLMDIVIDRCDLLESQLKALGISVDENE